MRAIGIQSRKVRVSAGGLEGEFRRMPGFKILVGGLVWLPSIFLFSHDSWVSMIIPIDESSYFSEGCIRYRQKDGSNHIPQIKLDIQLIAVISDPWRRKSTTKQLVFLINEGRVDGLFIWYRHERMNILSKCGWLGKSRNHSVCWKTRVASLYFPNFWGHLGDTQSETRWLAGHKPIGFGLEVGCRRDGFRWMGVETEHERLEETDRTHQA